MMSATMDWMMWEREHGCTRQSCRDGSLVDVTGVMTKEKKRKTKQQDNNKTRRQEFVFTRSPR